MKKISAFIREFVDKEISSSEHVELNERGLLQFKKENQAKKIVRCQEE